MPVRSQPDRAADRTAILAVLDRMTEAWNRNDAEAYAALFAEDVDYVAFDGTHLAGRTANAASHAKLFETVLKGSRLVMNKADIRFLTGDVAIVHSVGTVMFPWQREPPASRRSIQTLVFQRRTDGWTIAAFHNARIKPVPQPDSLAFRLAARFIRLRAALSARPARRAHLVRW